MIMICILVSSLALQSQVDAATPISIYINGNKVSTDQAPVIVSNRTLLPLRAIFEGLGANVNWNQKTKVVTATRGGNTIILKLGAKTATINNKTVTLDVPVQSIKGRILVPVRFVSEALGEDVVWNSSTKKVTITTSTALKAVSYVNAKVISQNGNGSDLQVSFPKLVNESGVSHYRILVVKSALSSNFNPATALSNVNYTSVPVQGRDITVTLSSQAKDVNGALITGNQSYVVYVMSVGEGNNQGLLSNASPAVTLSGSGSVAAVSNLVASDVSNHGDGRDLQVSFNKMSDESKIGSYRIFVVKANNASYFDLNRANSISSAYYTSVAKTGNNISQILGSSARDVDGAIIKNGVIYRVFVLSVGSGSYARSNVLSSYSSAITLSNNTGINGISNLLVSDVNNYNDGRDLQVTFSRTSDETNLGHYRIMVVKTGNASNFTLSKANQVSSSNYTYVAKTGYNISQILGSSARDVDGAIIQHGVSYRVFILSVGSGSYAGSYALSSYSSEIILSGNLSVGAVTNIGVTDIGDNNDGRDLRVTFNRVSNESYVNQYRIMVVKSANASSFTLAKANAVSSSNYTYVAKTGNNISQILATTARDVDGATIKNDVNYKVFVLTVADSRYSSVNVLSSSSAEIVLKVPAVAAATNVTATKTANDTWTVNFTKPNERGISYYEVMIVPASQPFTLTEANSYSTVTGAVYEVIRLNDAPSLVINKDSKDVNQVTLSSPNGYYVYILSKSNGGIATVNALSAKSHLIKFD
ncbi:hypothetical protein PNBC_16790 [Paenibacillus crassostreae]|uniref:Copper amine oxidase-like N-terminal domain-containing protein n=2 Tax=Paenibacillus crassostreae TaxID=1763538 RepID=A0A167BX82_9BACL|nr:hypothetical protein LPB68_10345 [Paenibacillus crassostreae]OAB72545.1 hypothetical protein PNBC_16790 [Paenibacillus crassostreae]